MDDGPLCVLWINDEFGLSGGLVDLESVVAHLEIGLGPGAKVMFGCWMCILISAATCDY